MSIVDVGTIAFWCKHEHPDWTSNSAGYNFGTFEVQQMRFKATKHPDRHIELDIDGPLGVRHNVYLPIPACNHVGLHVAITWQEHKIIVYLNGRPAQVIPV